MKDNALYTQLIKRKNTDLIEIYICYGKHFSVQGILKTIQTKVISYAVYCDCSAVSLTKVSLYLQ
jgi:hypothetical protein